MSVDDLRKHIFLVRFLTFKFYFEKKLFSNQVKIFLYVINKIKILIPWTNKKNPIQAVLSKTSEMRTFAKYGHPPNTPQSLCLVCGLDKPSQSTICSTEMFILCLKLLNFSEFLLTYFALGLIKTLLLNSSWLMSANLFSLNSHLKIT
ncbi:hypothetical protein BpHYR1_022459 [Brachionus plicatilis]|uniref:Uncharacterized protein n=1 Tax=Brachionus plicatilis TaxID=10195 RepID=A0A3M7R078_BRAPC|nr:hypothetical protein BpHYR1_022459 [Brachionus plicatilis]